MQKCVECGHIYKRWRVAQKTCSHTCRAKQLKRDFDRESLEVFAKLGLPIGRIAKALDCGQPYAQKMMRELGVYRQWQAARFKKCQA